MLGGWMTGFNGDTEVQAGDEVAGQVEVEAR